MKKSSASASSQRMRPSATVTIAVVQIECHQAALLGSNDFLAEPYVRVDSQHAEKLPLQELADSDFEVADIQQVCRSTYLRWSQSRLRRILDHLKTRSVDVVVFPEYSIPFEQLPLLRQFSRDTGAAVFAGTHCPPPLTARVISEYEDLGVDVNQIRSLLSDDLPAKSVLPVFYYSPTSNPSVPRRRNSDPDTRLYLKRALSVFEFSDWGRTDIPPTLATSPNCQADAEAEILDIQLPSHLAAGSETPPRQPLRVFPRICAEALQLRDIPPSTLYDLALITAYHHPSTSFEPEIHRHIVNNKPVVLCNDGRFGGSRIAIHPDARPIDGWWLRDEGKLPQGDSCLIARLDFAQLGIQLGCNNPPKPFDLVELSAVIPGNESLAAARASSRLAELRQHIEAVAKPNVPSARRRDRRTDSQTRRKGLPAFNEERTRRILETLLQMGGLTDLQSLKVRRLLNIAVHDPRTWAIHANDILFTLDAPISAPTRSKADSHDGVVDLSQLPMLRELEARLARYCLTQLRALTPDRITSGRRSAILHSVRERLSKVAGVKVALNFESTVRHFFASVSENARKDALRVLTDKVGELVERYESTAAWLYRCSNKASEIRLVVAHNTPFRPLSLSQGASLVKQVAETRQGQFYGEILYRSGKAYPSPFNPVKTSTQSAIAVPLLRYEMPAELPDSASRPTDDSVLGVLTLESNQLHAFTAVDLIELQREATRLIEDLLVIDFYERLHGQEVWRPQSWKWDRNLLHNAFCFELCSAVPVSDPIPGFGCTLWFADHGTAYDLLAQTPTSRNNIVPGYARGVTRFDYEYVARRAMPLYRVSTKDSARTDTPVSFTGKVVLSPPRTVSRQDWRQSEVFQRQVKAARMELKEVLGCPVYRIYEHDFVQPDGSSPRSDDEAKPLMSLGALNLYFYEDEYGQRLEQTADLLEPVLASICDVLGRAIHNARVIIADVAVAVLRSSLENYSLIGQNQFNIIRDFLSEVLEAEGCSIFHREAQTRQIGAFKFERLQCVSTSGLSQNGQVLLESEVFYDFIAEDELTDGADTANVDFDKRGPTMNPHYTVSLLNDPGVPLRRNFHYATQEGRADQKIPARKIESDLLSEHEHRRILAIAVPDPEDKSRAIGVVRLARSLRQKPFMDADADLLVAMCQTIGKAFRFRQQQQTAAVGSEELVSSLGWMKRLPEEYERRESGITFTCERLIQMSYGFARWSRCRVESVLQDVFYVLRPYYVLVVSLRFVGLAPTGGKQLKLFAFHSRFQLQPPDETAHAPLTDREGGVGWCALSRRETLAFRKDPDNQFADPAPATLLFQEQEKRLFGGICIPFVLYFDGRPVWALLSADFGSKESLKHFYLPEAPTDVLSILLRAAFKLSMFTTSTAADQVDFDAGQNPSQIDEAWSETLDEHVSSSNSSDQRTLKLRWWGTRWRVALGQNGRHQSGWWSDISDRTEHCPDSPSDWYNVMSQCPSLGVSLHTLVDRSFPQVDPTVSGSDVSFCRFPVEIADQASELDAVGAKIDFGKSEFVIPLYVGPQCVAELCGGFEKVKRKDRNDLRQQVKEMFVWFKGLQKLWNDCVASPTAFATTWQCGLRRREYDRDKDNHADHPLWPDAVIWDVQLDPPGQGGAHRSGEIDSSDSTNGSDRGTEAGGDQAQSTSIA